MSLKSARTTPPPTSGNSDRDSAGRRIGCSAHSCPERASVYIEGAPNGVCSWHHFADPHHWPAVTEERLQVETARLRMQGEVPRAPTAAHPLSKADKIALLGNLRTVLTTDQRADPKAWARKLQARHEAGEALSSQQIDAYTRALHLTPRTRATHIEEAHE